MSFGQLKPEYEMSQEAIAKELKIDIRTVRTDERKGIEKIKKIFEQRGITINDLI